MPPVVAIVADDDQRGQLAVEMAAFDFGLTAPYYWDEGRHNFGAWLDASWWWVCGVVLEAGEGGGAGWCGALDRSCLFMDAGLFFRLCSGPFYCRCGEFRTTNPEANRRAAVDFRFLPAVGMTGRGGRNYPSTGSGGTEGVFSATVRWPFDGAQDERNGCRRGWELGLGGGDGLAGGPAAVDD